jgi:hypothetical protein
MKKAKKCRAQSHTLRCFCSQLTARGSELFSLVAVFQRHHQEIVFPAAFIDPVDKIAVKRHIFNR